jgi:hypothetical protein
LDTPYGACPVIDVNVPTPKRTEDIIAKKNSSLSAWLRLNFEIAVK